MKTFVLAFLIVTGTMTIRADTQKSGNYLFLGNNNIPPIIFLQNNVPTGLVVDIIHSLAKEEKLNIEIRAMDWSLAQAMVLNGQADALLQINSNPEREKVYDFSDNLLESQFVIFHSNKHVALNSMSALAGHKIGVEASGYPLNLVKKYPNVNIQIVSDWKTGFDKLKAGDIDAVIVDRWVGEYVLAINNISGIRAENEPIETSFSHIAVKKGNSKLLNQINTGLRHMRSSGEMQRILDKWSGKQIVYLSKEQVNFYYFAIICSVIILILLIIIAVYAYKLARSRRLAIDTANHDFLSGLASRRYFYDLGERIFEYSFRDHHPLAVLLLDIDNYKSINDRFGHAVGDEVIKAFAKIAKSIIRNYDICGRLGGDEFALLLLETNVVGASQIAERILQDTSTMEVSTPMGAFNFSVSIGIAELSPGLMCLNDLLAQADTALYQAKTRGRNCFSIYPPVSA
jgi:diguanylate cyclase (GGDEF)-like protein